MAQAYYVWPWLQTQQLTVNTGSITASAPALDAAQTWNNAAVTFTGIKFNVTDTASAAGSLLMDLQVGGATRLSLGKNGNLYPYGSVYVSNGSNLGTIAWGFLKFQSDGVAALYNNAGTDFSRLQFGGTTNAFPAIARSGTGLGAVLADNSLSTFFTATYFDAVNARITAGSGTGITVLDSGASHLTRQVYKVTIDKTAFTAAQTSQDVTLATLPAKTLLLGVYADVTQAFALAASNLTMVVGRGSGGSEFLASMDVDAGTGQFGDADAELGTELVRAAAIQGGKLGSWASTQAVVARLISDSANLGNGSATSLTTGSITFYLITERLP